MTEWCIYKNCGNVASHHLTIRDDETAPLGDMTAVLAVKADNQKTPYCGVHAAEMKSKFRYFKGIFIERIDGKNE